MCGTIFGAIVGYSYYSDTEGGKKIEVQNKTDLEALYFNCIENSEIYCYYKSLPDSSISFMHRNKQELLEQYLKIIAHKVKIYNKNATKFILLAKVPPKELNLNILLSCK